ncbi:MAG: sugar phosphate nucleotidyltransferase [Gemmatimonadota bacterium]|nr:sugar phosphate nucleotidyltransferase [Gemmatimonadota bacterium]
MKAVIPLAGKGTRLRPHTHLTPKPLVNVGGKPVMSYILDDLEALGVDEIVFIVGYLQDTIRGYMAEAYPSIKPHYAVQEVQDGTAGAVALARPWADEDLLILFVDTLFDADLSLSKTLHPSKGGIIWAKEVEDYQRFGVIVTDDQGHMTRIVEKPSEPISKLANIGLYYIRDHELLFKGIDHTLAADPGPSGEYYLTDAFQYMVDHGSLIETAPVEGWYDCGKVDALLDTNRHLVSTTRGGVGASATVEESDVSPQSRIEDGATVLRSRVGSNVTIEAGAHVEGSDLEDVIVGREARVTDCRLRDSIVGAQALIKGFNGSLSVLDHSEVVVGG